MVFLFFQSTLIAELRTFATSESGSNAKAATESTTASGSNGESYARRSFSTPDFSAEKGKFSLISVNIEIEIGKNYKAEKHCKLGNEIAIKIFAPKLTVRPRKR